MAASHPVSVRQIRSVFLILGLGSWLAWSAPLRTWGAEPSGDSTVRAVAAPLPAVSNRKTAPTNMAIQASGATNQSGQQIESVRLLDQGSGFYLPIDVEFVSAEASKNFKPDGSFPITQCDRFAEWFVPAEIDSEGRPTGYPTHDVQTALSAAKDIAWYERASVLVVPPPAPVEPLKGAGARSVSEKTALGGVGNLTGSGVTIAIIDSGVDFRHPDFITTTADGHPRSRIKYFWDTTTTSVADGNPNLPARCKYPSGAPIGTVYTQDELTQDINADPPRIKTGDAFGHGTACASIAAGNGAKNWQSRGVAPAADLIVVRIARQAGYENAYLMGAICDWLDKVVGNHPLVVSCSFGGRFDGHDGFRVSERELDARFPLARQGRALCITAGNQGNLSVHAGLDFGKSDSDSTLLEWKLDKYIQNADELSQDQNALNQDKVAPTIQIWVATDKIDDLTVVPSAGTQVTILDRFVHGLSKSTCIELQAGDVNGSVRLVTVSGTRYDADAYIIKGRAAIFARPTSENSIDFPGTSTTAITVGSYIWKDQFDAAGKGMIELDDPITHMALSIGAVSAYSSWGYRRTDDLVKPDFVAPGEWFTAAAAQQANPQYARDQSGWYCAFNGTSAATPYTAGVVALMFQAKPTSTFGQIKDALHSSVTRPKSAGKLPNNQWGYGKLDLAAVEKALDQIKNEKPAMPAKTQ